MTLAGIFTLAAVALSLQFVPKPMLPAATLLLLLFIGLFLLSMSMNEYIDPRSRLNRMGV